MKTIQGKDYLKGRDQGGKIQRKKERKYKESCRKNKIRSELEGSIIR